MGKLPVYTYFKLNLRNESFLSFILLSYLILSLQYNVYSQANDIVFEHYSTDDGLSAPIVRCMIQDKIGYMWFGTYSGLDRYDGISFKSYKNIPGDTLSLINAFVQCLLEDRAGNLWVGTTNGLDKLDRTTETFTHFKPFNNISASDWNKNNILSIEEDKEGNLWVGTGDGLNKFDPSTEHFTHFRNNSSDTTSLRHNVIYAILEDKKGLLWIGTGNGLDKFERETGSFTHCWRDSINRIGFYKNWIRNKNWITTLYEDEDNILWVGTQGGLLELNSDRKNFTLYEYDPNNSKTISFYGVTSLCEENVDALWVGTWNGLNLFDKRKKQFTRIYHNNKILFSLSHNSIATVFRERSKSLWVTTYGGGVNKVNRTKFPFKQYSDLTWKEKNRFASASIMDMSTSKNGSILLATPTGLMSFDPTREKFYNYSITQNVRIVKEDKKENLWIGFNSSSGRGLIKYGKNKKIINVTDSSGNKFPYLINGIVEYDDSTLWLCTEDIGVIAKVNTNLNIVSSTYKIQTTLNVIYKDVRGLLWIGTRENGLICFDPAINKIIHHYVSDPKDPKSLSGNTILAIYEDKKGFLWLGTNLGLNKFDSIKKEFYHFTELNGLPHNWVYLIFEDTRNNIWVNTLKGISKFIPSLNTFKNYDVLQGIVSPDRSGIGCQSENGEIYLDSPGGLTRFYPDSIVDNQYIPPIVITNITVDSKPAALTDNLELPFSSDHITFDFAALSFVRPEKNLYAYKLENIDEEWIQAGMHHTASYTNLKPGEYTFRAKGSNNDGIWNEAGTSIKIIIYPPWWKSGWALTGYGILAIYILYLIRLFDLKRQRLRHQLELEHEHTEKLEEVDRMKSRLFANISHEFRTPLTLIQGPVDQILSENLNEKINKNAILIKSNANNMLSLINQLLDLSKIDSGKLQLKAAYLNIIPFIRGIVMSFESLAIMNSIKLNLNIPRDKLIVYFDAEKMSTILKNLILNAFKFTRNNNEISILVDESSEKTVEIKVRDKGIGISEDELPKIFNRFYQINSAHNYKHNGTGIGLALVKELVELHHGSISVGSKLGEWTEFKIILPIGKEHLTQEEIDEADDQVLVENLTFDKTEFVYSTNYNSNDNLNTNKNIILVVEDNAEVREFIKDSLGKGYYFEEAENGLEGLKKAEEIIPDLIISDIMMPQMDGNNMSRKLKSDQKTSHIPIILLTAKSEQENKIEGLESGADEYLIKPFDIKELQLKVRNIFNLRKNLQEKIISGDCSDIRGDKRLSCIDEKFMTRIKEVIEKHLSEEEFSIEEFAKEAGMSRTQLHRKIKALVGKSASQYVRSIRLNKAKQMIEEQKGNISEIAYSVGFSSPSYFTHCFKEEFGHTPKENLKQ